MEGCALASAALRQGIGRALCATDAYLVSTACSAKENAQAAVAILATGMVNAPTVEAKMAAALACRAMRQAGGGIRPATIAWRMCTAQHVNCFALVRMALRCSAVATEIAPMGWRVRGSASVTWASRDQSARRAHQGTLGRIVDLAPVAAPQTAAVPLLYAAVTARAVMD